MQASLTTWYADYPSAANFLLGIFGCAAFRPNSDFLAEHRRLLRSRRSTPQVARAPRHRTTSPGSAAVDRAITDQAPAVVLFSPRYIDFISARVGNYGYHEVFRWLIHRSWVQ